MTDTPISETSTDGRDPSRASGRSANPTGEKPGTLTFAARFRQRYTAEDFDAVSDHLMAAALEGHMPSVRFVMERLVPKGRGRAIAFDLPRDATRAQRTAAIAAALFAGEISPDEAKTMLAVLATVDARAAAETGESGMAAPQDATDDAKRETAGQGAAPTYDETVALIAELMRAEAAREASRAASGDARITAPDLLFTCISPPRGGPAPPPRQHGSRRMPERAPVATG